MNRHSIAELFDLSGQVALVTGAAQGIGQAIALRLAEAGAAVVAAGHNAVGLAETKAVIEAGGERCETVSGDVCDDGDLDAFVAKAVETFGSLDILVNAVGGMHPFTPALDLPEEVFDATIQRNLRSAFALSKRAAKVMLAQGRGGRIINVASMAGLLFSSIGTVIQGGFVIGAGILLDTFLVRTITVPAMATLVGEANWWPSRPKPQGSNV